jgi:RNA polymerase sigma-70 factor (ECF subfamily)
MQAEADRRVDELDDVERAAAGDRQAFERLYRRSVDRVYSLSRRMAGAELADDLTQEVFIRAWQKLPTFQRRSRFSTWLHRLAVNHILSRREQHARREKRSVGDGEERLSFVADRMITPGLGLDLEGAIDQLPEGAREIFVLYDVEGYSHKEIAERMNISTGTSKSQLHRARMMLRELLN